MNSSPLHFHPPLEGSEQAPCGPPMQPPRAPTLWGRMGAVLDGDLPPAVGACSFQEGPISSGHAKPKPKPPLRLRLSAVLLHPGLSPVQRKAVQTAARSAHRIPTAAGGPPLFGRVLHQTPANTRTHSQTRTRARTANTRTRVHTRQVYAHTYEKGPYLQVTLNLNPPSACGCQPFYCIPASHRGRRPREGATSQWNGPSPSQHLCQDH